MSEENAGSEVNPNTEVGDEGTVEASATGGVSFDDLDKMESQPVVVKPSARRAATDEQGKDEGESKEDDGEASEDVDDNERESEGESEESDKGDGTAGTKLVAETDFKGRNIQGELGEESVDLNTATIIPVKIDGEMQGVQIQALINNYSGNQAWEKRFTELDKDRQGFMGRVTNLNNYVQDIFDTANQIEGAEDKTNKAYEVLYKIGNLVGQDGRKLIGNIQTAFMEQAKQLSGMSESEVENWELKQQVNYNNLDRELASQAKQRELDNTKKLEAEQKLFNDYGLDLQSVEAAKSQMVDLAKQAGKELGNVSAEDIVRFKRFTLAQDAVAEFDKAKLSDSSLMNYLYEEAVKDPSLTREDIVEILNQSFEKSSQAEEKKSAKNIKRKLSKTGQATKTKRKAPEMKQKKYGNSGDLWNDV